MIPSITETFPGYATLHQATISLEEMGDRIITTRVKIDGDVVPDFKNTTWELTYNGEKFVLDTHTPQATKDDTTRCSQIDLTFESEAVRQLKRYFYVKLYEVEANTPVIDRFVCPLRMTCADFMTAFGRVLSYYFGVAFSIEAATGAELPDDVRDIDINYSYLWDVVQMLYSVFGMTWRLETSASGYKIVVGAAAAAVGNHVFKYGYSGGLAKIERQIEDAEIYNVLFGRGGTKNLPYRYFKKVDENNPAFAGDPDACAELENIYFDRLLDINFRYYIKGWLRNPRRPPNPGYPIPITPEPQDVQNHWAYQKGYTDSQFDPVEYVKDDASILEYGRRHGKLDDNDDIYPTIQGIDIEGDSPNIGRVDEIVAVGEITDGDDSGATGGIKEEVLFGGARVTAIAMNYNAGTGHITDTDYEKSVVAESGSFRVEEGFYGRIEAIPYMSADSSGQSTPATVTRESYSIVAVSETNGKEFAAESYIPGGDTYTLKVTSKIAIFNPTYKYRRILGLDGDITLVSTKISGSGDAGYVGNTFDVWVKNIWETAKGVAESDIEYAERVWGPILGDRYGSEAKLVFSTGGMSASSDWEFVIAQMPVYDISKSRNGVSSHWRITLGKSDAELEATGKWIPNTQSAQPVAGDYFFFIGIDMPHNYVEWAEKRVNEAKTTALNNRAYANPTWAVQLDGVRINTLEGQEVTTLMSQLGVGKAITIADPRFTNNQNLTLVIRTMSITWAEGTVMKPKVDIVLSENVLARAGSSKTLSPAEIQTRIEAATSGTTWMSMGTYVSKRQEDTAYGKLHFPAGATFGGSGAKIDETGHAELKSLSIQEFLEVPELRYNRVDVQVGNYWRAPGGGLIDHVEADIVNGVGTIFLKLEEGEVASVAAGDLCIGIFHNEAGNASQDGDDSKGNFHFAGFSTCYFRITEVLAVDGSIFKYAIRPTSASWTESHHPQAAMTFVCYGNTNDATRQVSRYSTRTYERYLKDVDDWEITADNLAAQFGDLTNLTELNDQTHNFNDMTGYSAYLENIYMSGFIKQTGNLPAPVIEFDTGGKTAIIENGSLILTAKVKQGWDDITSQVTAWTIARDSGNPTEDVEWAQDLRVTTFAGSITLEDSDIPDYNHYPLFRVSATVNGVTYTGAIAIPLLEDGSVGEDAIMLSLDHYTDFLIYDADGSPISDNVIVGASLRKGSAAVSGVTYNWSLVGLVGIPYGTNNEHITISAAAGSGGTATATVTYDGVTYTAVIAVKRISLADTFDIEANPNAVTYNTTTGAKLSSFISVTVYRTRQAADGSITREAMSTLDSNKYLLYVGASNVTQSYTSGAYLYTIPSTVPNSVTFGLYRNNTAQTLLARVVVPINKSADGAEGPVGVTYRISAWKPSTLYRNDVADPPSGTVTERFIDIVTNMDAALLSDPNLIIKQAAHTHTSSSDPDDMDTELADSTKWGNINQLLQPVATPLLLAHQINADIINVNDLNTKLLTVRQSIGEAEVIYGSMGSLDADPTDGKVYPLWVGGATGSAAKFKVDSSGNIYAGGGIIGAFTIDSNGNLVSYTEDSSGRVHSVELRSDRFIVAAAKLGVSGAYRIVAGVDAGKYIDDQHVNAMSITINRSTGAGSNTALSIASSMAAVNYGIKITAEDYAVYCDKGMFGGLRPATRYYDTSGTTTLSDMDFSIVANNTAGLTLNLPSSSTPKNGQTYFIHHLTTTTLTINKGSGSSAAKIRIIDNTSRQDSFVSNSRELIIITYVADYGAWIAHQIRL